MAVQSAQEYSGGGGRMPHRRLGEKVGWGDRRALSRRLVHGLLARIHVRVL